MKATVLSLLVGTATAFVPGAPVVPQTSRGLARTSVNAAIDEMLGADMETRGPFDPLKLAKDENLFRYREVELKHGRLAMLAFLGYCTAEAYRPFFDGAVPNGLGAIGKVPTAGWLQILLAIGAYELSFGKQKDDRAPGDYGFGIKFYEDQPEKFAELQLKELKNGRLAMIGISAVLAAEAATGQTISAQINGA
uniref:Plastid light harvesting protein n=1 Tax=Chromera velia CCMP2878 TaxID=1169474 RepID=A0A0G4GZZ5_9ALVE|mmetsp:Transcript_25409/g.49651  ORF Transcript_25409/g.49651 Transcript_25409/m.49651 type:complete len:194 (-) Transcript_25409:594-1175(-)|eukprot:Cvel_5461.t1-p1 / transcript=Cvel_5461.t1 / gene=Cvel_5461 / organism=Chromera_velia_CCMP2878 / gene_product=Fucoxanthin-chlorophyll a-c binding protein E,, putative / transcript_product=Fucoxanthin-chlorophyll a-c binding protein E,, putative / location=Cvel_scaffold255:58290-61274(-) / protein_length=193 / sequence_SO=supercontig / SO=protein_coding / is_pseudo=false